VSGAKIAAGSTTRRPQAARPQRKCGPLVTKGAGSVAVVTEGATTESEAVIVATANEVLTEVIEAIANVETIALGEATANGAVVA